MNTSTIVQTSTSCEHKRKHKLSCKPWCGKDVSKPPLVLSVVRAPVRRGFCPALTGRDLTLHLRWSKTFDRTPRDYRGENFDAQRAVRSLDDTHVTRTCCSSSARDDLARLFALIFSRRFVQDRALEGMPAWHTPRLAHTCPD